jgi:hypothetical protein
VRGDVDKFRVTSSREKFCCGRDTEYEVGDGTSDKLHCCLANDRDGTYNPTSEVCCNGDATLTSPDPGYNTSNADVAM